MFLIPVDDDLRMTLIEQRDADPLFGLVDANRDHLAPWLPWVHRTRSPEDVKAFIDSARKQYARDDGFHCCVRLGAELVGVIGLHWINRANRTTSIGYWIARAYEGRGIMTRCTAALLAVLFDEMDLNRVEIRAAVDNARSRAVPERLGFVQEGELREIEWLGDRRVDHALYALLRSEWRNRRTGVHDGKPVSYRP